MMHTKPIPADVHFKDGQWFRVCPSCKKAVKYASYMSAQVTSQNNRPCRECNSTRKRGAAKTHGKYIHQTSLPPPLHFNLGDITTIQVAPHGINTLHKFNWMSAMGETQ